MSKWLQEFYPVCFFPEERAMLPCLVGLGGSNGSQVGCVGERSLCPGCEQEVLCGDPDGSPELQEGGGVMPRACGRCAKVFARRPCSLRITIYETLGPWLLLTTFVNLGGWIGQNCSHR